jgi:hypothetical protein
MSNNEQQITKVKKIQSLDYLHKINKVDQFDHITNVKKHSTLAPLALRSTHKC